jgi:hypothetical protein
MIVTLNYSPGQTVTIFLETLDANGERAETTIDGYLDGYEDGYIDSYHHPMISQLIFPDLELSEDYPAHMIKLDAGLYYAQFVLPTGATAVGSYLVDISYSHPEAPYYTNTVLYQIVVNAAYGQFSINPG